MIGGGDWAVDRIVPDAMWALGRGEPIGVRNPAADPPLAARDSLYLVLARWEVTALLSADQRLLKLAAKVLP